MNIQSSFHQSVNGIERAPRSNLARLPLRRSAISGLYLWGFTLPKESHALVFMKVIQPLLFKRLLSVAVCHLVSTPLSISKLISKAESEIKSQYRLACTMTFLSLYIKCKRGCCQSVSSLLPQFAQLPFCQMLVASRLCPTVYMRRRKVT